MRAGALRHRLQIQEVSGDQDATGEPAKEWTTIATVWGEILPLMGRERMNADQVQGEVTHRINMRARKVSPKARLVFTDVGVDRIFNVISVLRPTERRISIQILAQEQVT